MPNRKYRNSFEETTSRHGGCKVARFVFARPKKLHKPMVMLLAAGAAFFGLSQQAWAPPPPTSPTANRVYGGCTFSGATLTGILNFPAGHSGAFSNFSPSVIVILNKDNPNFGQSLDTGGTSGAIVCANSDAPAVNALPTSETTGLPESGTTVDITDTEQSSLLQYDVDGNPADRENRICITAGPNNDCFRITD